MRVKVSVCELQKKGVLLSYKRDSERECERQQVCERDKGKECASWWNRWSNLTPHPSNPEAPRLRPCNHCTPWNFSLYCPERYTLRNS